MLFGVRYSAAGGAEHAQAARRCPIGARARPAPHPDRPGERPGPRPDPRPHPAQGQPGSGRPGWTDRAIATALEIHHTTVARVRQQYAAGGLDAAVDRKAPEREYPRKLDGEQEAHLAALACSAPPEGRKRWTLRLLADRLVQLEVVDAVSHETVRQALKQTGSSRG